MALGGPWGGFWGLLVVFCPFFFVLVSAFFFFQSGAFGGFGWSFAPISTFCFLLSTFTRVWLWVALPRLSRLDVGCSTFEVRCSGPRTVPVRSGSEWAWVLDLLAPSCPRGRCEPGRFAVRSRA